MPAASSPTPQVHSGTAVVRALGERWILLLADEVSRQLPSRGQVAVQAVLNGQARATVLEPDGRKGHWIPLDDALRATLDVRDGDTVEVRLSPTTVWPEPAIPEDLGAALAEADDLEQTWQSITPMARWEWVRWVDAAKSADTRAKRVDVSIDKLRGGTRRPCCFDLSSCTDRELSRNGKLIGLE